MPSQAVRTSPARSLPVLTIGVKDAEHVVVARRGVVTGDDGLPVDDRGPARGDVHPAAAALGVAPADAAVPAHGLVLGDQAIDDDEADPSDNERGTSLVRDGAAHGRS